MNKDRYGDGNDSTWADSETDDETPVSTGWIQIPSWDRLSVQLLIDPIPVTFMSDDGDSADLSDAEFAVAAFDFTGYDGGTLTVSGSEEEANNGTFDIVAGSDGVVEVDGTLADETFTAGQVTFVATPPATSAGAWAVEVSNDNVPASNGTSYGAVTASGTPTDITSGISPALSAVVAATAATHNQWAQLDLGFRAVRFTFTPTAGDGRVRVLGFAKALG